MNAMQSNIQELIRLLPPPTSPRHNRGDWAQVEAALNTALPDDFKEFTEAYGSVKICNYLVIHTPFPFKEEYSTFLGSLSQEYDSVVGGRDKILLSEFPEPGGLLGIGGTDSADVISWITKGQPNEWGIFFWKWPGTDVFTFEQLNLTGFLVDLVSMRSPLFPLLMPEPFFSPEKRGIIVTN